MISRSFSVFFLCCFHVFSLLAGQPEQNSTVKQVKEINQKLDLMKHYLRKGTNMDTVMVLSRDIQTQLEQNMSELTRETFQDVSASFHLLEGERKGQMSDLKGAINHYEKAFSEFRKMANYYQQSYVLNRLLYYYQRVNNDNKIIEIVNQIKQQLTSKKGHEGIDHMSLGDYYLQEEESDSAIFHYELALSQIDADTYPECVINCRLGLGLFYEMTGQPELVIEQLNLALPIAQKYDLGFEKLMIILNKGVLYGSLGMVDQQLEMLSEAERLCETVQDIKSMAKIYNGKAACYDRTGQHQKAIQYYKKSLELVEKFKMGRMVKALLYNNIGNAYLEMDSIQMAMIFLDSSIAMNENSFAVGRQVYPLINLGYAYLYIDKLPEAEKYAKQGAIGAKKGADIDVLLKSSKLMYLISKEKHDYQAALTHLEEAMLFQDSIFSSDLDVKLARQEFDFKIAEHQKELELTHHKIELVEKDRQLKSRTILGLTVFILSLIIIGWLVYRNLNHRYRETKQKNDSYKKELEFLRYNISSQLEKETAEKEGFVLNGKLNSWLQDPLSKRELDVLSELAKGYNNKKIGEVLFISENTVRSHLSKIYDKLDVKNRIQAIRVIDDYRVSSKISN